MCQGCDLIAGLFDGPAPEVPPEVQRAKAIAKFISDDPELSGLNQAMGIEMILEWVDFAAKHTGEISRFVLSGMVPSPFFKLLASAPELIERAFKDDPAMPEMRQLIENFTRRSEDITRKAEAKLDGPTVTQAKQVLEQILSQTGDTL